jgi:murein DD-endopeptidase MepM/ murein hydrolase activator NlpD
MRRPVLLTCLFIYSGFIYGQLFPSRSYPRDVFRNPLGIPISLAANFGELRSNHYHMGLDIRTAHRENLPVYAAADGYIFRVKIEPFGFGQAIYIRHSDGYTSLYAHLNSFYPALDAYVKQKQYELQRWDVSLDLAPGILNVKKGELVAYSGNMGGSQGPHLHFEIRTFPDDINLNPMLFGLPVKDNVPPVFRSLSVYDRSMSFYEQYPRLISVRKVGARYEIGQPVLVLNTPNPGFGIQGFDTQSGSTNPNGIFEGILYDNGAALSGFQMDRISYNETRGINAHIDYPTRERGGPWYQLLFKMPGYKHSIYRESIPGGTIHLEDGQVHEIRIELKDAYGNASNLVFKVKYEATENLRNDAPQNAQNATPQNPKAFLPGKVFYPGMLDGNEAPNAAFYLGPDCLYDSLHIVYQEITATGADRVSALHHFGTPEVPLADTMTVRIKLSKPVAEKEHVIMLWENGDDFDVKKPAWLGDWATATFQSFGNFSLVLDTIAPVIRIPGTVENANLQRSSRIAVMVTDNYKKIRNFRATLDGKWLLFTNDKAKAFIYHFDGHCPPGRHELKIYAEDEAGNASGVTLHFMR